MDLRKYNSYGARNIGQYSQPQNYELEGKEFEFLMDDGYEYTLRFIDKATLEWCIKGEQPRKAVDYLCNKGDETTYLVSYELVNTEKRANHTWAIDLENRLVTRVLSVVGENPKFEYLITPKYEFGAIKHEGAEVKSYPRHGFTSDLVGNIVQWRYGSEMETVHVYYCTDFYRITYPSEKAASQEFNETLAKLPSSDEPTAYIKIKDGMYLFSLTEANAEKVLKGEFTFRSNTMVFLQNYKRVFLIGRAFGTVVADGNTTLLHTPFSAYGRVLDPAEDERLAQMLTAPNPYIV